MAGMITYADTRACPSCRGPLPSQPTTCPTCGVYLQHTLATQLFHTLSHADVLAQQLRAASLEPAEPTPSSPRPAYPTVPPLPANTGMRTSSVPAILLGLGALCLLVASVAFLAVAWSWLGLGGRTVVLVGLTAVSGTAGLLLHRRGLRVAAESLVTVALGLLTLDVLGAQNAGWLGDHSNSGLACIVGLVLAGASVGLTIADRELVVPQLTGALGLMVAFVALHDLVGAGLTVAAGGAVVFVLLARVGHAVRLPVSAWAAAAAAGIAWCDLLLTSMVRVADLPGLTVGALWVGGPGWALVLAALLLLSPIAFTRNETLLQLSAAASGSLLTAVLTLPVLDDGATRIGVVSLLVATTWAVGALTVAHRRVVAGVPAVLSSLPAIGIVTALLGQSVGRVLDAGSDLHLSDGTSLAHPLLVVATVALAVAAAALASSPTPATRTTWVRAGGGAVVLAAIATLALYPVPLWTVAIALCLTATAYTVDALRQIDQRGLVQLVGAGAVALGAVAASAPSAALMAVTTGVLTLMAAGALTAGRFPSAALVGGAVLPLAASALLWSAGEVVGLDVALRAVPVLLVVGALALVRPRLEVEAPSMLAGFLAAASAVPAAGDGPTSLALHLTLAGALVTASSLVHPHRRMASWAGGALLMLATWVRLADLGISAPEAYTLPTAVALVLVGLLNLHRHRSAATSQVLLPGLLLTTVPSLLWVMASDPVSLRALLLGLGCLTLVLLGARLGWSAPLVVGAVAGGLLALVELAPYAAQTPQWVVIGLAGTALTLVGVTWERRLVELRRAAGFIGRLR